MIEDIQNNTIIICENNFKTYVLKEMSKRHIFLNIKFFTKREFLENYLFKYNEQTLFYLVNKYNMKVDIAKMYLNNLFFVKDNIEYKDGKLKYLVELKKELDNQKLLEYNNGFKQFISSFNILVYGYPYLNNFEEKIFDEINAKFVCEKLKYIPKKVFEFHTINDEINFVAKSICKLLKNGVDINKIKLMGLDEDYYNDLNRIFNFYNLPIKIPYNNTLYGNIITKKFLDNYSSDIQKSLEVIKNENSTIVNKIINICNKYSFVKNYNDVKLLIIEDLKNTRVNNYHFKNYIEVLDITDVIEDNYVFLMNFNNGIYPKTIKDESYITDNIKDEIKEKNIILLNKLNKEYVINKIQSIKNLTISYKLRSQKGEYYPSSLIQTLNLEIIRDYNNDYISYSKLNDKINYAILEDKYKKYGVCDEAYKLYKNNLGDILYNTYDNNFSPINSSKLKSFLKNKLILSYSSLNNYKKCAFRYYIANILKLDKYEESFEAFIGSIFHDVLEKCFINNLDVNEEVNEYIKNSNKILTLKERYFVSKITEDIKYVIKILKQQQEFISLDKAHYEKNVRISKNKDIDIEFIGFIDKILYKEKNDETLVSIIDYKTGNVDIDLKYLPYGLSLQLPIYLYLVKKSNIFKNPKFIGFYLQYILDKDITRDNKKTYDEMRMDKLKLMGYSTTIINRLSEFDSGLEKSSLIKGMQLKTDGSFSRYAKVLTDDEIDKIVELTEDQIDDAIDKILDGKFSINPKKIGYDLDLGCKYCKFKDLCFKKEENYVIFKDIENLDFLRGDENA